MATRAKFRCACVEDYGVNKKVKLTVVGGLPDEGPNHEDNRFTKYTPCGEIWMTIDNPAASVQFEAGKHYYVDFTAAD
jgi:hypothetical protein